MKKDDRLRDATASIFTKVAAEIQGGPFKGMTLGEETSWYGGNVLQKLLGIYESELVGEIERIVCTAPDLIINVGCAEGYYAVGFALRLPNATVHAFDADPRALQICEASAKANRAENNFRFEGSASQAALKPILRRGKKTVLFVDCEGCERRIFEGLSANLLGSSIIVVECHDFLDEGVTEFLERKLVESHDLHLVRQESRNPDEIELLSDYPEDLRWLAMSEGRPVLMHWLCAYPRQLRPAFAG